MAGAGGRIERDALAQFGKRLAPSAGVPQRDAEVVVGLGRVGLEGDRALEVGERADGKSPCWPRTNPSRT